MPLAVYDRNGVRNVVVTSTVLCCPDRIPFPSRASGKANLFPLDAARVFRAVVLFFALDRESQDAAVAVVLL